MNRLSLFEAVGIEIEYMIVDRATFDVRPLCDRLIETVAEAPVAEIERGPIAWSNELALHVLEFKTNGPAPGLEGLAGRFHSEVIAATDVLHAMHATLLPGGTHPWMDPSTETRLWPHEYNDVYRAFDRIFGCTGHGWSNLQSTHVNLPFGDDREFHRLHSAIRVALPLVPALSASSPFLDGRVQAAIDARLEAYSMNSRLVPQVAGEIIPDVVRSEDEYRDRILEPLYAALAPHDPEGVLRHEWANARGAIARFERGAVEIRVLDAQECPTADMSIVALVVALVRALTEERWAPIVALDDLRTRDLAVLFRTVASEGGRATVEDPALLNVLGLPGRGATAIDVWRSLAEELVPHAVPAEYGAGVESILRRGCLAESLRATHERGASLHSIASELERCLKRDELYEA